MVRAKMMAQFIFIGLFTLFCVVVIGVLGLIVFVCQTIITICDFIINAFLELE